MGIHACAALSAFMDERLLLLLCVDVLFGWLGVLMVREEHLFTSWIIEKLKIANRDIITRMNLIYLYVYRILFKCSVSPCAGLGGLRLDVAGTSTVVGL